MNPKQRFRDLDGYINKNEIISGDGFKRFCEGIDSLAYQKRDFLFRSGEWRGVNVKSVIQDYKKFSGKTLVVGHSDLPLEKNHAGFLKLMGIGQLFGVNTTPWNNYSHSLPLGITNQYEDTPVHKIFGNNAHFLNANRTPFPNSILPRSIYFNFTGENNPRTRQALINSIPSLKENFEVVAKSPSFTNEGRIEYLEDLRRYDLILCPEGNGVDTHRLWETLYMGGMPVIVKNSKLDTLLTELPVMILNSWNDIQDKKTVYSAWRAIHEKEYNFDTLKLSYWCNQIFQSRNAS